MCLRYPYAFISNALQTDVGTYKEHFSGNQVQIHGNFCNYLAGGKFILTQTRNWSLQIHQRLVLFSGGSLVNLLEKIILGGANKAFEDYNTMSGGHSIWEAPESFLQTVVDQEIAKMGYWVFLDTSIQKVLAELKPSPGPALKIRRQRPDISIWNKTKKNGDYRLRAIIEIKRAWNSHTINGDAKKIEIHLRHKRSAGSGYILAYGDARPGRLVDPEKQLQKRFKKWAARRSWSLIGLDIRKAADSARGFCLLRCQKRY
jgi:hypothetical protein